MIDAVAEWVGALPFVALWLFFFAGGMARGHVMYVIGRGIAEGARRSPFRDRFTGPHMDNAKRFVDRWGAFAVTLSYLTVGFQTLVQVATGVSRMSWWRFFLGAVVGSVAWATIYTTVGFAAWEVWLGLLARSPWAIAAVLTLAVFLALRAYRASRARREQTGVTPEADSTKKSVDR